MDLPPFVRRMGLSGAGQRTDPWAVNPGRAPRVAVCAERATGDRTESRAGERSRRGRLPELDDQQKRHPARRNEPDT